jgi:long-chain-fatty-acid--[acyl-carrier-protein] ligase
MLPSVTSSSILLLAVYLAGKTPVLFNWTLGKESFDHCYKIAEIDTILSSSNFYEKVENDFL